MGEWQRIGDWSAAAVSYERALSQVDTRACRGYASKMATQRAICMDKSRMDRGLEEVCTLALELGALGYEKQQMHRIRGRVLEGKGQFAEAVSDYDAAGESDAAARARMLCDATGQKPPEPEEELPELEEEQDEVEMLAGHPVKLVGLKNAVLNGQCGTCGVLDRETGRYAVTLDGSGRLVAVKPTNLHLLGEDGDTSVGIEELAPTEQAEVTPAHTVTVQDDDAVVVVVELAGVASAAEVDLECAPQHLSLLVDGKYKLEQELPIVVDHLSIKAQFDKGNSSMCIRM